MAPRLPLVAGLAAGGFVAYRAVTWRRRLAAAARVQPDARAEELRRKLDEVKGLEAERAGEEAGEIPIDRAEAPGDLDERRRAVHERGRATVDEMRRRAAGPDRT